MIKLLGALLILLCGTAVGFLQAAKYTDRTKELRSLIHALQRLQTEINYGHTPLPEAFTVTAATTSQPIQQLFIVTSQLLQGQQELSLQEAWTEAIERCWANTSLRDREKEVLLRMGTVLGMSDSEDQQKHIQLAQLQLKAEEEVAREEQDKFVKMWRSLGALGSILIVILMV